MRAIAANEGRYPISAQCRLLGVARSTYYSMRSRPDRPAAPDPAAPAVVAAHAASKGRYGSRKIKASLERSGVTVSRRRVCRIMRENGLVSAYARKRFKVHPGAVNEADVPNVVARGFGGRAPRTHICSDLTYVRVGASWNYVCLLVDLYNREIVGHLLASIYFSPVSPNRRAVRAKAVSPVAPTYFHRFRSRLDGPVPRQVLQPVGPAGYLDQVAVAAHPVRDRARRHVVPEHPAPAADPHVGGDDRRALLVARRYQLEQQVRARAADVEVAELVDDQQPRVGVVLEPLLEDAARRGVLKVLDEPGAVHEPDLAPRPDRLDAQRDGEMRLAHAGASHEQDVLGPLHEPEGRELLDLGARDRRLEVPVEVRQPLDVGNPDDRMRWLVILTSRAATSTRVISSRAEAKPRSPAATILT